MIAPIGKSSLKEARSFLTSSSSRGLEPSPVEPGIPYHDSLTLGKGQCESCAIP
jgi:hypothetical protein